MDRLKIDPKAEKERISFGATLRLLGPYVVPAFVFSSGIFAFFTPVLFIFLGKFGKVRQILTALLSNALILVLMGQVKMVGLFLIFTAYFALGTLALVDLSIKKKALSDSWILIFISGLWISLVLVGGSVLCQLLYNQGLLATLGDTWNHLSRDIPLQVRQDWLGEMSDAEFAAILPYQVLSAMVSISIFTGWLCLQTATALSPIRRLMTLTSSFKVSDLFLIPTMLLWAWILFEDQLKGVSAFQQISPVTHKALEIGFQGLASLYFIQGLTVFGRILADYKIPRFFRMLLSLGVIMLMLPAFAFVGGLDALVDLRKRLGPKLESKE